MCLIFFCLPDHDCNFKSSMPLFSCTVSQVLFSKVNWIFAAEMEIGGGATHINRTLVVHNFYKYLLQMQMKSMNKILIDECHFNLFLLSSYLFLVRRGINQKKVRREIWVRHMQRSPLHWYFSVQQTL